ncbi:MAG: tripartite tricarboxylate transporter substrate binding protein [Sulfuricaulis sp.]|nr:tripartite tricarboxylate transporter substrate binding protein [Sulfuricaulis sp.]
MNRKIFTPITRAAVGLVCSLALCIAAAQDYPSRPITLVVSYPAGGIVDLIGRLTGPELTKQLGRSVIIENVSGASGTLGAAKVVAARPDGHTLLIGSGSEISIAKLVGLKVTYDGERDLSPISLVGSTPMVLVGGPKVKANTLDELLAAARAKPGQLTYASTGIGTPTHIAGELIKMGGHVDITHVPYKGAPQIIPDLMGGHIELSIITLSSALPHINSGKLKAFGVTEAKRSRAAPDIPALAENKSLADVDIGIWWGLFAPAKTPAAILQRLHKEFTEALQQPKVIAKLTEQGASIVGNSPVEFQAFIRANTEKYRKIVQSANIRAE